jgi:nitrogen fixation NifU-like protein
VSDLRELYQEVILDHGRQPRNFRAIESASGDADGFNPLCGDKVRVYVKLDGDVVSDVSFTGDGCAISKASASLMTQAVKGRSAAETERLFHSFHALVTGQGDATEAAGGKLDVFAGVAGFPARVKCASLAWHTLRAALAGRGAAVTTE